MAFASRTLDRVTGMNSKAGSSPGFFVYVKYFSDFYIS
jgi:hypothetical protein